MAVKAKAAVLTGPRQIEINEFDIPETGAEEGILRIEATGVCGSDIPPFLYGGRPGSPGSRILGHEIVGRIERIGPAAAAKWGVREGDRIIVEEHIPCGICELCYAGLHRLCVKLRYGSMPLNTLPYLWGGYADHLYLHPNAVVYKAPEDLSAEEVALFIPMGNGINWVQQIGGARVGDTVLILGPGQHGLGCVIGANEAGAYPIIAVGLSVDRARLELAKKLGATHIIVADEDDQVERVRQITGGRMADIVIDSTAGPNKPSLAAAFSVVKAVGGTIVLAGGFTFPQDAEGFGPRLLTLKTVWGRDPRSVTAALTLMKRHKYPLHEFCTHSFAVEETAAALLTAARELNAGPDPIHVSVVPSAS